MLSLLTVLLAVEAATGAAVHDHSNYPNPVAVLEKRTSVTGTAVVNLGINTGDPRHLASGFIYGIPDTAGQIPDHFYTDVGFNFGRAGGAQTAATGWLGGVDQYVVSNHYLSMTSKIFSLTFSLYSLDFNRC